MRAVDRSSVAVPPSLAADGAGPRELLRVRGHRSDPATSGRPFAHGAYRAADVKLALETLFHGKCAYCETRYCATAPVDVEHYRPKGAVAEADGHGGYWWMAAEWANLLPSCIDCNRRRGQVIVTGSSSLAELAASSAPRATGAGKKDSFPLADERVRLVAESGDHASEGALLLDPCRDDPAAYLGYGFATGGLAGLVLPVGDEASMRRAATSIQVYGLNRLGLVQDRTELVRRLEFLANLVIELTASAAALEEPETADVLRATGARNVAAQLRLLVDRTLEEMVGMAADHAPHASMARAWLREFRGRVAAARGDGGDRPAAESGSRSGRAPRAPRPASAR